MASFAESAQAGIPGAVESLQQLEPTAGRGMVEPLARFAAASYSAKRRAESAGGTASAAAGQELSLRQVARLARKAASGERGFREAVEAACMLRFVPKEQRLATEDMLAQAGIDAPAGQGGTALEPAVIKKAGGVLTIGSVRCEVTEPNEPGLVPSNFVFVEIPQHTRVLESMLADFLLGEHILLIGNQGVGKNKLCDRLLELMQREREYVQLHRDTTVQQMTLTPALRAGRVVWEDSPLVRAMSHGRILVVDEADKAAAEVVGVLKGLLEDGEIHLGDGRRFGRVIFYPP